MPNSDYFADFFGIFGEKCCLPAKEMGCCQFDKPEKVDINLVNGPITGQTKEEKEFLRGIGRPGLVIGPDEDFSDFSNRDWMTLPWNTDFKAARAPSVRTPLEMNSSLRPASLASRIDEVFASDPRRGSGGYYHPALHISDLSIPAEEDPVLLPFQTKESAYPLQKLVDRVIFLKIYSDTVEADFNLTERDRIYMFGAMHEWDLEAVVEQRCSPAGERTFACTHRWPPPIRARAIVCAHDGALHRILPDFDAAWADAKYRVLFAMTGQLVARTPVDLLLTCHAAKICRYQARRRLSRRGSAPTPAPAVGTSPPPAHGPEPPHAGPRRSRRSAEFVTAKLRSAECGAQLATVIRTREILTAAGAGRAAGGSAR